jgi:hypothetical protein
VTTTTGLPVSAINPSYGTAFPSTGTPGGFMDGSGAFASFTGANGKLNVLIGADSTINAAITSSALPTGASTDASVQNIEAAIRETTAVWNTAMPIGGLLFAAKDSSSGLVASLNSTSGALSVSVASNTQGNGGDHQAVPARVAYIAGRSGADALGFIRCDSYASISTANSGNWRLVASSSGANVYVCGYTFVAAAPVSVAFVQGRDDGQAWKNHCDTQSVNISGAMPVAASGGVVNSVGINPVFKTSSNLGLCINLSTSVQVSGHLSYTVY